MSSVKEFSPADHVNPSAQKAASAPNASSIKPSETLPVIKVNGEQITEEALANELQYHQHNDFNEVVRQAGQALVIRQLLLNEAKKQQLDVSMEQEESSVQTLLGQQVSYDDPSEEDCQRYFDNNAEKFVTEPLFEVDHILLAAAKDDIPARTEAEEQATVLIEKLTQDMQLFPVLALEFSACPSKETGGSLGQISKGQTVPEFERELQGADTGLLPRAIETRYGFHVVNIKRKILGKPLEYPMVADKIRGYLVHRASHLGIQAYLQSLVEQAQITGLSLRFDEENVFVG